MSTPRSRRLVLVGVNLALLLLIGVVAFSPAASAEGSRPRGRYIAVSGGASGTEADAIWIVDTVNREMIALTWDPNLKQINGIGYRDLAIDAATSLRGGGR